MDGPDFETLYFHLLGRVADASDLLIKIQEELEELYFKQGDCEEEAEPEE